MFNSVYITFKKPLFMGLCCRVGSKCIFIQNQKGQLCAKNWDNILHCNYLSGISLCICVFYPIQYTERETTWWHRTSPLNRRVCDVTNGNIISFKCWICSLKIIGKLCTFETSAVTTLKTNLNHHLIWTDIP